jgi:hypothetical protein
VSVGGEVDLSYLVSWISFLTVGMTIPGPDRQVTCQLDLFIQTDGSKAQRLSVYAIHGMTYTSRKASVSVTVSSADAASTQSCMARALPNVSSDSP